MTRPPAGMVAAAVEGDPAALLSLMNAAQPDVRRYARAACRADDVDDAVQETLWLLYRRVGTIRTVASFSGWLFSVVRRECLRLARSFDLASERILSDDHAVSDRCDQTLRLDLANGMTINPADVAQLAAPASLIIAHNAAFDRRFPERFSDVFTTKPWACSLSQIDWAAEGFEGTKLAYLAQAAGFFYDRHRAMHDCLATVELLSAPLPRSGVTGLSRLLDAARLPTWRIWAENSPFDLKDILKARGYRWNGDGGPQPRAWYIDVPDAERDLELHFLKTEIYRRDVGLTIRRIEAHDRFSDRV